MKIVEKKTERGKYYDASEIMNTLISELGTDSNKLLGVEWYYDGKLVVICDDTMPEDKLTLIKNKIDQLISSQ